MKQIFAIRYKKGFQKSVSIIMIQNQELQDKITKKNFGRVLTTLT